MKSTLIPRFGQKVRLLFNYQARHISDFRTQLLMPASKNLEEAARTKYGEEYLPLINYVPWTD